LSLVSQSWAFTISTPLDTPGAGSTWEWIKSEVQLVRVRWTFSYWHVLHLDFQELRISPLEYFGVTFGSLFCSFECSSHKRGWGALRQLREDEAHGPHVALLGEALIGSGWSGGHADASVLGRGRSQVAGKSRDTTRLADANRCHIYRIFHLHFPGRSCKKFCVGTVLPINTAECTLYLCRGQSPDTCSSWDQNALRWGTQRCGLYMPLYRLLLQRFVLWSGDTKYHAFQCWTKV